MLNFTELLYNNIGSRVKAMRKNRKESQERFCRELKMAKMISIKIPISFRPPRLRIYANMRKSDHPN